MSKLSKLSKLSELSKLSQLRLIHLIGFIGLFSIAVIATASSNAALTLTKDKGTGLFILNMRDPQGIKSFSLVFPTDKLPYSGDLNGCPASRKIDNITINDPADFKPLMNAVILDCQGNETEFEIGVPIDGIAQVKKTGIEPTPTPTPTPQQSQQSPQSGGQAPAIQSDTKEKRATDTLAGIQYPVKELGNCENKDACKTYCERADNLDRCIKFAEENHILKHEEIERGKKFSEIVKSGGGPAGCKTEKACFEYCNDVDRIDECVAFAEKNGFMEGKELEEAKKIQSIVKSGKSLPGNCKNRAACEAYCKNTEHLDECIAFAKENGMMSEEEIKEVEKFLPLMKSGQTPGGCKSREECDAFCNADDHFEECFAFADKAGLITDKEREIMKKTGGKGPGGCRGRACQTFCENPANQKACFEFGKEHGLIGEEDLKRMEEGKKMLKEQLETGPPEIQECLRSVVDVTVLESEGFAGGPELGEKMKECFEKLIPEGMGGKFEFGERGEFSGPGGCKSREECETYCRTNPEACGITIPDGGDHAGFDSQAGPPAGGGGFAGPGGCKSREECEVYCRSNPEACGAFITQPPMLGGTVHNIKVSIYMVENGKYQLKAFSESGILDLLVFPLTDYQNSKRGTFSGLPYGAGINCGKSHEAILNFPDNAFPLKITLQGCDRNDWTTTSLTFNQAGVDSIPENFTPPKYSGNPNHDACVLRAPDGQAMLNDWKRWTNDPGSFQSPVYFTLETREIARMCSNSSGNAPKLCPAMPTVNECPQGQKKTEVFNSPECGAYYACVPELFVLPNNTPTSIDTDQYRQQYEQQFQQQYPMPAQPSP